MTSMRNVEKMFFACPEVDVSAYPQAAYEGFLLMEQDFESEFVCIFPFVRKEKSGAPHVEIFIMQVIAQAPKKFYTRQIWLI